MHTSLFREDVVYCLVRLIEQSLDFRLERWRHTVDKGSLAPFISLATSRTCCKATIAAVEKSSAAFSMRSRNSAARSWEAVTIAVTNEGKRSAFGSRPALVQPSRDHSLGCSPAEVAPGRVSSS
jgi:hypothetical protein